MGQKLFCTKYIILNNITKLPGRKKEYVTERGILRMTDKFIMDSRLHNFRIDWGFSCNIFPALSLHRWATHAFTKKNLVQ